MQEDEDRYYATAVIKRSKDRLKLATVEWRKEPLESWRARAEDQMPKVMAVQSANYRLPTISDGTVGCTDDTWTTTAVDTPASRVNHTAVWTGSEMIVWGGNDGTDHYLNTGGRYNPSTDTWTGYHHSERAHCTTISHGSLDWQRNDRLGRHSDPQRGLTLAGDTIPSTDTWIATSTTNAPAGRNAHTAVWTGSEMIIWGGYNGTEFEHRREI